MFKRELQSTECSSDTCEQLTFFFVVSEHSWANTFIAGHMPICSYSPLTHLRVCRSQHLPFLLSQVLLYFLLSHGKSSHKFNPSYLDFHHNEYIYPCVNVCIYTNDAFFSSSSLASAPSFCVANVHSSVSKELLIWLWLDLSQCQSD